MSDDTSSYVRVSHLYDELLFHMYPRHYVLAQDDAKSFQAVFRETLQDSGLAYIAMGKTRLIFGLILLKKPTSNHFGVLI